MDYKQKYLKYKLKYLLLKQQQQQYNLIGGSSMEDVSEMLKHVNDEFYEIEELEDLEKYHNAEKFILENISEQERKGNTLVSSLSTPMKERIEEAPLAPLAPERKGRQEILCIKSNRLEMLIPIIENLKETYKTIGDFDEDTFKLLFDEIFQLDGKDDEQIMILNLVLFIKDFEHDYENYLKEEPRADDDRINILIKKCIRKLDEKIKLERYSFSIEMLSDEMLRQGYIVGQDEINDTYASLLLRGNLDEDFYFKIPDEEYDIRNILQDQGYNPMRIEAQRIELDGLSKVIKEELLGTKLDKKRIYEFITEKWLKYIFYSLCRLEIFYLNGKDLDKIEKIFSLIMKDINFNVDINDEGTVWTLLIKYKDIIPFEIDISSKGISAKAFEFMYSVDTEDFCKTIINDVLVEYIDKEILNDKDVKIIIQILWTRLRDIFKLVFGSLKTLGDKSYEFLLVIFVMKYIKDPNAKFLIETRDNHFINSLFVNIIPLIKLLKVNFTDTFNLGIRFPVNKSLLKKNPSLIDNKSIIFTHNQNFSSAKLFPDKSPLEKVPKMELI